VFGAEQLTKITRVQYNHSKRNCKPNTMFRLDLNDLLNNVTPELEYINYACNIHAKDIASLILLLFFF
jgi:hypothetical protein